MSRDQTAFSCVFIGMLGTSVAAVGSGNAWLLFGTVPAALGSVFQIARVGGPKRGSSAP